MRYDNSRRHPMIIIWHYRFSSSKKQSAIDGNGMCVKKREVRVREGGEGGRGLETCVWNMACFKGQVSGLVARMWESMLGCLELRNAFRMCCLNNTEALFAISVWQQIATNQKEVTDLDIGLSLPLLGTCHSLYQHPDVCVRVNHI